MTAGQSRLTVVIPTHNGAARIGDVLRGLAGQTIQPGRMDVLVVDNGSATGEARAIRESDAFAAVSARYRASVLQVAEPGLTNARIEGVRATTATVVLFVDDDAVPAAGCCDAALQTFDAAQVGVAFGRVYPAYSIEPHYSIRKREGILAVNHRLGDEPIVWKASEAFAPTIGAALAVRRQAFLDAYPWQAPHRLLPDRVGTRLVSGGDLEIGQFLARAGWWRVYNPAMIVHHAIAVERLRPLRFCKLIVGIERSRATFEDKFGMAPGPTRRRALALRDLAAIVVATPFWLVSRDGPRGWLYAVVSRIGRLMSAYPPRAAIDG